MYFKEYLSIWNPKFQYFCVNDEQKNKISEKLKLI